MSTTTVSMRSTTRDAEIEELRRREAEARKAARRAAQRAEEQRRREEALRRRIAAANRIIADEESRFQSVVARLDAAARRLPDLALKAPELPALSSGIAQDPARLEAYAAALKAEVENFSRRLDGAIAEAERLLERRLKKAAAWRTAADLERQMEWCAQASREAAARLRETLAIVALPAKPHPEAELEVVEAYVAALRRNLEALNRQHASLCARLEARERAVALGGSRVQSQDAAEAHARHEAERVAAAQAALRAHLQARLAAADLALEDLPEGLRGLIDDALAQAHCQDQRERITRWIAREKQSRDGVRRALELIGNTPDLAHDDPRLARRWESLLAQLQRIASGLEAFTPGIEREYAQIQADARRLLSTAFTKADWVQAMSEQGFEIFERADGEGLIVVDLDHPEVWLEATPLEAERGGFAAVLELKTDAESPKDEAQVTDSICAKLAQAAGGAKPDVKTEAEVIERKSRITRGRRPAKAWAQQL
jgi:hypothetical protein